MRAGAIVVGGGIAGLAAADRLAAAGLDVTLLESSDRLGGNVRTAPFAGRPLDFGAEMLVTADPAALELCRELSLGGELVTPAVRGSHVWDGRRLRPLPSGALTRLPGRPAELLRSRLLSPRGVLRCGRDLVVPSRAPEHDVSVGAVVRDRVGAEVLDRLVDPLLGGIHAGRCDDLSAQALAPHFLAALATGKGLIRGLRSLRPAGEEMEFIGLRGGMESLVHALADRVTRAGVRVITGTAAAAVETARGGGLSVRTATGETLDADACVIATPARAAGAMLVRSAPAAAAGLTGIAHAEAAVVALAYPADALARLPEGTGFVTAGDDRLVRACTWASAKWGHLAGEPAIVKAFVGRAGSPPPVRSDAALAARAHDELACALGLREAPVEARVERFAAAIPQYAVGHPGRVVRIEAALPARLALAGASYRGAGLSACIRSGRAGADRVLRDAGAGEAEAALRSTVA